MSAAIKTRRKYIWLLLALGIVAAAAGGFLWLHEPNGPRQIITLPDGQIYEYAGVTYGTNCLQPTATGKLMNRLPSPVAKFARQMLSKRLGTLMSVNRPEPVLCVWFRPAGMNAIPSATYTILPAVLADEHDAVGGVISYASFRSTTTPGASSWRYATFQVAPRRSPVLQCFLFSFQPTNGQYAEIGHVRFLNPLFGRYPQWQPKALPAVQKAGDVEVRLENFMTGSSAAAVYQYRPEHGIRIRQTQPREPQTGETGVSVFDLKFNSPRGHNEIWTVESAELSDATGNKLPGGLTARGTYGNYIQGTLWPDEGALRLKLELKRSTGNAPEENVTFKNVPVPAVGTSNTIPLTNIVGGVPFVLSQFVRLPDAPDFNGGSLDALTHIQVDFPAHRDGWAVDFAGFTTETGVKLEKFGEGWRDHARSVYVKSLPAGVKTVDITWIVQKTRSVEFLVKPREAAAGGE